jgi:hypothetical protein
VRGVLCGLDADRAGLQRRVGRHARETTEAQRHREMLSELVFLVPLMLVLAVVLPQLDPGI